MADDIEAELAEQLNEQREALASIQEAIASIGGDAAEGAEELLQVRREVVRARLTDGLVLTPAPEVPPRRTKSEQAPYAHTPCAPTQCFRCSSLACCWCWP